MSYDNALVKDAARTLLQAAMHQALRDVETRWSLASGSLSLPATWATGHNPDALTFADDDYPLVAVLAPSRRPEGRPKAGRYQEQEITLYVDFVVRAPDVDAVNALTDHYAEALCRSLATARNLAGYRQVNAEPEVQLTEATRVPTELGNANMFEPADVDFVRGGRIIVLVEGASAEI